MDQNYLQKMKDALKGIFKVIRRPHIFIPILIIVTIVALVAPYIVILDDASYKEDDMSNAPYAATKYTSDTTIDEDGNITSSMTAHELWDELVKNESNITEYLDSPEELLKLMNAEVVTQYLDTRENPDEPINWDEMDDIDSNVIHGIIKLRRADTDGNTSTMTYVDPETFQSYIDAYNESGSDADRDVALSHFTLEQSYTSSATASAGTITAGTQIDVPSDIDSIYTYMGWHKVNSTSSNQYKLREQAGENYTEDGIAVINGRYVIACTETFGTVGDYIDFYLEDGTVLPCIIGDIKSSNDSNWCEWGHIYESQVSVIELVVNQATWEAIYGEGTNAGTPSCHPEWDYDVTHAINGGSYFDNPNFTGNDTVEGNGNSIGGSGTLVWPTLPERITITSEFGYRDAPTAGASSDHKGIDIDTVTGDEVYATASGTVIYADSAGSAGNLVTIDHGDGYITKYMHNDSISVSVGDTVSAGDVIAISGNTGVSTGDHLHFQIEYNGEPVDPLSFKYNNGKGNGTGGFGDGTGTSSQKSTYYAKVATWRTQRDTVETTDPDREGEEYDITTHSMSTTKVNFQEYVSGYTMPFDYLWALLTISQRKEFVLDLADLVRDSEIEITIHDNLTITTTTTVDEYTNKMKTITSGVAADVTYTETTSGQSNPNTGATPPSTTHNATENADPYEEESEEGPYTYTHTIVNTVNSLDIALTKANVWIVEYTQNFEYQAPQETTTGGDPVALDDEPYPSSPNETSATDPRDYGTTFAGEVRQNYISRGYQNVVVTKNLSNVSTDYYYAVVDKSQTVTTVVNTTKYVSSPPNIREKTDKNADEDNFVTILLKTENYRAGQNILSGAEWLFQVLQENEKTVDMVDLTKYLLYKATGNIYDNITTYDFSVFDPENFTKLGNYGTTSGIDGVPGEIFDFLLEKGMPPVAAAAIVGNIEAESSFDTAKTNGTHNGLCQWDINDRFKGLESLASSKGTDWTDLDTQLEFMWQELEGSYKGVKDTLMSCDTAEELEYATWYFGRYYEVFFLSNSFEGSKSYTRQRYENALKWYEQYDANSASLGEAASIEGEEERIRWLYGDAGVPQSKEENDKYLETFEVEILNASGQRTTMNVTMHKKLKTEVQAIFKEMADAGFKIIGGDISYRAWGSDAGFRGTFPQSAHTYGHAFDVNPNENYCIYADGTVVGSFYRPGENEYSVTEEIINIWKSHGFYWGGDWTSLKDYMHFSYFNH